MPGNNIQDTNLDAMENDDFEVEVKVTASAFELEIEGDSDVILDENVLMSSQGSLQSLGITEEEDDSKLDEITNILELSEDKFPLFTLAKNKARFLRMVSWYRGKEEWIEVAPLSGVTKLFKQQTKELEGIRSSKLDYEMELETGTLTPSQRSYRRDELKMCKVQEKMAVHLISKLQVKIKSGRR
ncbi:MAG: hypothetical protein AABY64_11405 [Bdellovibrionota bacterium]